MSCSHANDAGVKCLGFEDVHSDNDACPPNMTEVNGATSTTSKTTEALEALTGLLAAALVIITIEWVVSCVYFMRKMKQR